MNLKKEIENQGLRQDWIAKQLGISNYDKQEIDNSNKK
jgi:hypothetical protein